MVRSALHKMVGGTYHGKLGLRLGPDGPGRGAQEHHDRNDGVEERTAERGEHMLAFQILIVFHSLSFHAH